MEQQERALRAYVESVQREPGALAVVLVGSVAQGRERADSDVDVYLVVDDARFETETSAGRFAWIDREGVDYPGSYIDVKLASPTYLARAAEAADDPTRASFIDARIAWSDLDGLDDVLARIVTLEEGAWEERVRSFHAQARLYGGYFLHQAIERDDEFLRAHAALHLSLAAARIALAQAHVLLPGPKYVSQLVRSVPTPDGFVQTWEQVVRSPDRASGDRLLQILDDWIGIGESLDEYLSTFIRDNELAWLRGTVPPEFW